MIRRIYRNSRFKITKSAKIFNKIIRKIIRKNKIFRIINSLKKSRKIKNLLIYKKFPFSKIMIKACKIVY